METLGDLAPRLTTTLFGRHRTFSEYFSQAELQLGQPRPKHNLTNFFEELSRHARLDYGGGAVFAKSSVALAKATATRSNATKIRIAVNVLFMVIGASVFTL